MVYGVLYMENFHAYEEEVERNEKDLTKLGECDEEEEENELKHKR